MEAERCKNAEMKETMKIKNIYGCPLKIETRLRAGMQRVLPPAIAEDGPNFLSVR